MAATRPPALLFLVPILALLLTACGGASTPSSAPAKSGTGQSAASTTESVASKPAAAPPANAAVEPSRQAERAADSAKAGGAAGAPAPAPAATAEAPQGRVAAAAGNVVPPLDQRIIRTGRIDLTVADVREAMRTITAMMRAVGGYIGQSATKEQGNVTIAELVLRVPVEQYDDVFQQLRDLAVPGKRPIESSESQDVTEEFTDLTARINTLKVTEDQLQKLLARAEKMEDILLLQRELTEVRSQIERLQGRLNVLDRRAAFSTIAVTLRPHQEATPPPAPALRQPVRGAINVAARPTFQWLPSTGAVSYDLQVALETDTLFDKPVLDVQKLTTNSYEWPAEAEQLEAGRAYIWRVRASNAAGASDWSSVWPFTTVPAWSPLRVVRESWAASLTFLQRVADVVLAVVVFFWWLIPVLLLVVLGLRRLGARWRPARPTAPATPPGQAPPV